MSLQLSAPHPAVQTTSVLPSPQFSNQEAITATVSKLYAVDGTLYTYKRPKDGRHKLTWTFLLTQAKALEVRAFVLSYFASEIKVVDHDQRSWVGYFVSNPFELRGERRGAPTVQGLTYGEIHSITLEFEGREV